MTERLKIPNCWVFIKKLSASRDESYYSHLKELETIQRIIKINKK